MIYKRTSTSNHASRGSADDPFSGAWPLRVGIRRDRFALEPRQLFDGAGATVAHDVMVDVQHPSEAAVITAERAVVALATPVAADTTLASARQLLVVDNSVANWQQIAQGAAANTDVLILDASRDGLSQIAQSLVGETRYSSIHIVSHGSAGALELGNRVVNANNLAQYQSQLGAIGAALAPGGDLLLYGCDIGAGQYGVDFLQALAQATHADVAASSDLTGAAARGGDWDLEVQVGQIEASLPISTATKDNYSGLLYAASALTIVQTSEAATQPASGNTMVPEVMDNVPVTVGEVVRMRMIVNVIEGADPGAQVRVALPDGVTFLNDGSAAIGFISDGGGLTATAVSAPGTALADGTPDGVVSSVTDVRSLRPSSALANSGAGNTIVNGTLSPSGAAGLALATFASGDDIRFVLGDLNNSNADNDLEFIVIEYNVVVDNALANQAAVNGVASATSLPSNFVFETGGITRFTSETDTLVVTEPAIGNVDKHVVSVAGNVVTFQASFTNTGDADLHDVRIFDDFAGATNLNFGTLLSAPGANDQSTASALDLRLNSVAAGATVTVTYTANVADIGLPAPSRNVVVTGTSLSLAGTALVVSDGEAGGGAPIAGLPVSTTTQERTGADGIGNDLSVLNNYQGAADAGLSTLAGTLWDDTLNPNGVIDASENGLGNATVSLTWAGPDNIFGNADDQTFATVTSSVAGNQGEYGFGALASGSYRITVPAALSDPLSGPVQVYFDARPATPHNDGLIELGIPVGAATAFSSADFGYLRQNAAPTIAIGSALTLNQDTAIGFVGTNQIVIADPDLLEGGNPSPLPATYETHLNVQQGVLNVAAVTGVSVMGNGSSAVTLTGTVADINRALAGLTYTPNAGFVGSDSLTVRVDDRGNIGEVNNNGIPGEPTADNLSATASSPLTVVAAAAPPPAPVPAPILPPPPVVPPPIIVPPLTSVVDPRQPQVFTPIALTNVQVTPYVDLNYLRNDFDPFAPWTSSVVYSPISATADVDSKTVLATQKVPAANVKGVRLEDDCVDDVATKTKSKPIKRSSLTQALGDKVKPFSEQISAVKRAFKPPAKLPTKASSTTKC